VNLLADPERQAAPFLGSRSKPQGASLIPSCFALSLASRVFPAVAGCREFVRTICHDFLSGTVVESHTLTLLNTEMLHP
jgi:hypothetical protein